MQTLEESCIEIGDMVTVDEGPFRGFIAKVITENSDGTASLEVAENGMRVTIAISAILPFNA